MAILIFCSKCCQYYSRKNKNCPKCGISLAGSKKFRINVTKPNGSRVTKIVEGNLTVARRVEAKIKTDISQQKNLGIRQSPLLSEAWEKYISWAKTNKKSWKADNYRWNIHVGPFVDGVKMDMLNGSDIQKIVNRMQEKGGRKGQRCSPATIKHVIVLIKRVYNWAKDMDMYTGENPANKIKPPKLNNQKTECLTREELERLMAVLETWSNRFAALLTKFALFTGFRSDECMGLEWKNIDFERNFVFILDPKGNSVSLPLNEAAIGVLKEVQELKPFPECPYVFPNRYGQRRVTLTHIWYRIRKAAMLPKDFRFHGLCHTYASYLASSGEVDLYTLQKLLNHQSPQMTQRYAHLLDDALRRGANVADEVFGKNSNGSRQ